VWELKKAVSNKKTIRSEPQKVFIKINKDCDEQKIEEVKELLENYRGDSAVYVYDEKSDKKYIMDRRLWVDVCDSFVTELKSVIDDSCIVIK
jgi:DNA polymerase-3 subunit alpha